MKNLRNKNLKAWKHKILWKIELGARACLVNMLLRNLNGLSLFLRFDMRGIGLHQGYWLCHEPKKHGHKQQQVENIDLLLHDREQK